MLTKQISVFVENRSGRVAEVARVLAEAGIDLFGITIADTSEFGVMRCLSDEPERAVEVLSKNGIVAKLHDTLVVEVADEPGGLSRILSAFSQDGINIEYLYSFIHTKHGKSNILFRVSDNAAALASCKKHGLKIVCGKDLYDRMPEA